MKQDLRCSCTPDGTALFSAIELAPELQALQCDRCEGAALNLGDYQHWRVRSPQPLPSDTLALHQDGDADARVRTCPSCARLMQRYRVGGELEFWIDRCSPCQLVWFERDEWAALADLGLSGQLRELLTDAWQRQQRDNDIAAQREATLRARHGDACMDELARVRDWLDTQAQRDELLALLRAGW